PPHRPPDRRRGPPPVTGKFGLPLWTAAPVPEVRR
ncbi:hypothetical protein A2U01_0088637, partial [Trifolium medium]|nr:hypothetical protein [Trifolium medium]